ncbi:MAG: GTPase ObgE [Endomicrobium sp.]|jgi:GTP-binding protein|nr:GTPase ObgE [Endomicrobium sp.]
MFVDKISMTIIAGKGGDGCISFRREKFVPLGGPNGGKGGDGGSVYLVGDSSKMTLEDLFYIPKLKATDGQKGSSYNKFGKNGKDLIIKIPLGTLVFKNEKLIADCINSEDIILIAKGGKGGRGNSAFKTSKHNAPRIAEKGALGEVVNLSLELCLIADVGIIGMPNAGKSLLLTRISKSKPKIANYPFTSLTPNLGVASFNEKRFTVADIPGIIKGAHKGKGLGHEFLRHIERTKILIHLLDVNGFNGNDPYKNYCIINLELLRYSKYLNKKRVLVVLNKIDSVNSNLEKFKELKHCFNEIKLLEISALTGKGISNLLKEINNQLIDETTNAKQYSFSIRKKQIFREYNYEANFTIHKKNGVFIVEGKRVQTLTEMTMFNEFESLMRYKNILKKMGLYFELKKMGAKLGDVIRIGKSEFVFEDK